MHSIANLVASITCYVISSCAVKTALGCRLCSMGLCHQGICMCVWVKCTHAHLNCMNWRKQKEGGHSSSMASSLVLLIYGCISRKQISTYISRKQISTYMPTAQCLALFLWHQLSLRNPHNGFAYQLKLQFRNALLTLMLLKVVSLKHLSCSP